MLKNPNSSCREDKERIHEDYLKKWNNIFINILQFIFEIKNYSSVCTYLVDFGYVINNLIYPANLYDLKHFNSHEFLENLHSDFHELFKVIFRMTQFVYEIYFILHIRPFNNNSALQCSSGIFLTSYIYYAGQEGV